MWALAVGGAGEGLLATGASDATVAVWGDCTAADEEEAAAEEAAIVLKQQDLSNALQVGQQAPPPQLVDWMGGFLRSTHLHART